MGNGPAKMAPHSGTYPPAQLVQYAGREQGYTSGDCKAVFPIVCAAEGIASSDEKGGVPLQTIMQVMKKAAQLHGNKPALRVEAGLAPPDLKAKTCPEPLELKDWKTWTWATYESECRLAAKGMIAAGVERFDGVNIFGFNSPEWFIGELGAMYAGGIAAGVYPTDTPAQVAFKSSHSNSSMACVQSLKQVKVFQQIIDEIPYMKCIVCWDENFATDERHDLIKSGITRADGTNVKVMSWAQFLASGESVDDAKLEERINATQPGNVCAYIYTSGTTGQPKAVMMTHDNVLYEAMSCDKAMRIFGLGGEERILSYLPLSHVAGMLVDIIFPICCSATHKNGWFTSNFARTYDLKIGKAGIIARLGKVKPTLFLGVPRVWEKFAEAMQAVGAKIAAKGGLLPKFSKFAKARTLEYQKNCQLGGDGAAPWFYAVSGVVRSKAKGALGLDEMKFAMTGAAPIKTETLEYFASIGIQINELYGMSECAGACTMSTDNAHIWGSCGYPMPGVEIKILKAGQGDGEPVEVQRAKDINKATEEEQGEICFRGRNNMAGYMANPKLGDEHVKTIAKKNADAIDKYGWLHSGDKGCMGEHGFVKITGRYKELIITAGGENVAPVPMEDGVKSRCPAISNIIMVGDKRKFNCALVTLKAFGTGETAGGQTLEGPAAAHDCTTITQAMNSQAYQDMIKDAIIATNKDGDCCPSNASKIQKFSILPIDVSVEGGELTATLKLKRSVVNKQYMSVVDRIFDPAVQKQFPGAYVPYCEALPSEEDAAVQYSGKYNVEESKA